MSYQAQEQEVSNDDLLKEVSSEMSILKANNRIKTKTAREYFAKEREIRNNVRAILGFLGRETNEDI
jgi:hypothetical protein